jgi:hypothetical protein
VTDADVIPCAQCGHVPSLKANGAITTGGHLWHAPTGVRLTPMNPTTDIAEDGLTIGVCSAEPGSRSQEALDLLASWSATREDHPAPTDR